MGALQVIINSIILQRALLILSGFLSWWNNDQCLSVVNGFS